MSDQAFLRMPLHLLAMVLSQRDSIKSLSSAIFSHSSLYAAFIEDRNRIVQAILHNTQLPPNTLTYALPTYYSSLAGLDPCDFDQMGDFLSRRLNDVFEFHRPGRTLTKRGRGSGRGRRERPSTSAVDAGTRVKGV